MYGLYYPPLNNYPGRYIQFCGSDQGNYSGGDSTVRMQTFYVPMCPSSSHYSLFGPVVLSFRVWRTKIFHFPEDETSQCFRCIPFIWKASLSRVVINFSSSELPVLLLVDWKSESPECGNHPRLYLHHRHHQQPAASSYP